MILENSDLTLKNALVNHYLPNRVLDWRWLLALPFVIALVLYAVLDTVSMSRWEQWQSQPTLWDMLIGVLGNHHLVHHGLVNMFIYLVSGIGAGEQLETQLLLRIGSRKDWLKAQVFCLFAYTVFYLMLVLLSALIIAQPFTRFSWGWEDSFTQIYLTHQELPAIWLQISPGLTTLLAVVLMGMAWLFIGLSTVFITILTQRPVFGFLCGMILNYSAFILSQTDVLWLQKIWFSRYMFLWNSSVIGNSIPTHFMAACLYWITLNTIGLAALWFFAQKLNFTVSRKSENPA